MEPDCYEIQILHYLNPHLIWVEVSKPNRNDEYVFEQIGVYGLLPYEITLEITGTEIKGRRCTDWAPAAVLIMKKAISNAKRLFFRPTYIDRRSSIFDDNIHKFGEIIIETSDRRQLELSQILIESGFAVFDVCIFHQELSLGHIITKLSLVKTQEVVRNLERKNKHKKKENGIQKNIQVFQAAENFASELTTMNLELHNQLKASNIHCLLERKMKDFNMCKNVDEESIGCGSILKGIDTEKQKLPVLLKKKLETQRYLKSKAGLRERSKNQDPLHILNATKKFLEENTKNFNDRDSDLPKINNSQYSESVAPVDPTIISQKKIVAEVQNNTCEVNDVACSDNIGANKISHKSVSKREKRSANTGSVSDNGIHAENRIVFGPPGIDITSLMHKVLPKIQEEASFDNLVSIENKEEENSKLKGLYDDVDSLVNVEIAHKDIFFNSKLTSKNHSTQLVESPSDVARNDDNISLTASALNDKAVISNGSPKTPALQRKLQLYKRRLSKQSESSSSTTSDTTNKDSTTSLEESILKKDRIQMGEECGYLGPNDNIAEIIQKICDDYGSTNITHNIEITEKVNTTRDYKNNVNPFKNIDDNISVFVDKLVSPVLMVHTKMDKRIEPSSNIREINFNAHLHIVLKNLCIEKPMMIQMVSWPVILRGFSMIMISSKGSGKTLGYLPAVCRLVTDSHNINTVGSVGPICIIVCATAQSVAEVEKLAKMFLGLNEKVLSCFAGVNELDITTSLLNGCDLFICTPPALTRLLQITNFGVDLSRLTTMVLEDCERMSATYTNEIKFILFKIKEMYKNRVNKESKVQFIVASRVWCDLIEPIAKNASDSVICIGAFQECVLYSKSNTVVDFVQKENKVCHILDFMKTINTTKRTIIVCRSDDEVKELEKALHKQKYIVFACNSTMTVEELYNLNIHWADYQEPVLGPILICCDGNLTHLNITDGNYLIHYSLPQLFSMFCKRFSVLNNNYSSIFKETKADIKIKVLIDEDNVEQLPKILNFVKRCTSKIPEALGKISERIQYEKDLSKGKNLIPLCDCLLAFGECTDFWNCIERHTVFKEYDLPKRWMPTNGIIKFKILYYHSPVHYSARLLSNTTHSDTVKYPQTYSNLHLKMGMYYSSETNRKLHGTPKVGDLCAVSIKQNFYARCQVIKILSCYNNGSPNSVLIKLIDEERLEKASDILLYHLPDDLKNIETPIVHVRLANIHPKDKDVTFSDLAKRQLKNITDQNEDLYLRGQVVLTIGNCVFVDTLETCQELTSLNETVVRHNFKKELLEKHAILNQDHVLKLKDLCKNNDVIKEEIKIITVTEENESQATPQWSHFENEGLTEVYFSWAINPNTFFVRPRKFESCMKLLIQNIDKYVKDKPVKVNNLQQGQIILAKFPDDTSYDRAKVYNIINEHKVKCFFVDHGDFREVLIKDLLQIPDKFITQIPFQTIECYLIGLKPVADQWSEFATNWLTDNCVADDINTFKPLYVKYYTKTAAAYTGGHKYGVALYDTTTDNDIFINKLMIDLNLAQDNKSEIHYYDDACKLVECPDKAEPENNEHFVDLSNDARQTVPLDNTPRTEMGLGNVFQKAPIRSMPLVRDSDSDDSKWEIVNAAEFRNLFSNTKDHDKEHHLTQENESKAVTLNRKYEHDNNMISKINGPATMHNITSEPTSHVATKQSINNESVCVIIDVEPKTEVPKISSELTPDYSPVAACSIPEKQMKCELNLKDELRKPKLTWWQNKQSVTIKIQLIGVENYELDIKDKSIEFLTYVNDIHYGFNLELYGVIERNNCSHSNKGTYILVKLNKIIKRNWLTLTKESSPNKWIVYDVDSIDTSSDEEEVPENQLAKIVKQSHFHDNSDSDDDFLDDTNMNDYNLGLE
ncbi:hypothetical protein ACJJTC_010989 [Scirpophaga incertulas]